jgi:hypothetical protein
VACQLETHCVEGTRGAFRWSLGATIEGGDILGATFDCTAAAQADVKRFLIIDPAINGGKRGLVSHVEIPPPWDDESLNPAESPHAVLLMTVEAKVPEDGSCAQVLLRYEDGLYWFSPVRNYGDLYFRPRF